jgi:large subunit ribosomal protein L20
MPRAKNNVAAHRRHKKVLDRASGAFGGRDRRAKKREFRALWITRISAAAQMCGMNYSSFMDGLKKSGVTLDRKALADIAARDMATFTNLANMAAGK